MSTESPATVQTSHRTTEMEEYTSHDGSSTFTRSSDLDSLINKEMRSFRLKYLCSQTCSRYYQYMRRRVLSGKAVFLVLFMCFLERLAYFGALSNSLPFFLEVTDNVLSKAQQAFIQTLVDNMIGQIMYPIAGWIADVWVGRHRVLQAGLWFQFVGYCLLAFIFSFEHSDAPTSVSRYLLMVCFIIVSIGTAAFQANMIPFGADQIIYKTSEELSSYFNWYYWVRNLGAILYLLSFTCSNFDTRLHVIVFGMVAAISICLALSLDYILKDWLLIDPERRNPLKTVAKVLYYSATVKRPRERSAFSFTGRDAPPRIDLAKIRHGGKFTNEEVEDVKTFLRLLVVLGAVGGALTVYAGVRSVLHASINLYNIHTQFYFLFYSFSLQITSVVAFQVNHMRNSFLQFNFSSLQDCSVSDSAIWGINIITILFAIPLLNYLLFPCLREYTPSMLKRIGIGYFFALLAPILLLIIEGVGHLENETKDVCMFLVDDQAGVGALELSSWLILLPDVSISFAEVFIFVSGTILCQCRSM